MLKNLIKLANHLDTKGLRREANALDKIIKKLAQSEELDSSLSEETGVTIDPGFLAQFHFKEPREDDKKHIAEAAYNTGKGDGYDIKEDDIIYNYNNGNFSIAVPTGDTYKSHLGYEVYVSYADERARHAQEQMSKLLHDKVKEMNFKESENLPAPMSDANMIEMGYMKAPFGD